MGSKVDSDPKKTDGAWQLYAPLITATAVTLQQFLAGKRGFEEASELRGDAGETGTFWKRNRGAEEKQLWL